MTAQFVHNEWIESYDPTIEDSYRTQVGVDVSAPLARFLPLSDWLRNMNCHPREQGRQVVLEM